jgi:TonB family protein
MSTELFPKSFLLSIGLHSLFILGMVFQSLFTPSSKKKVIPTLRVDIVALPNKVVSEIQKQHQNIPLQPDSNLNQASINHKASVSHEIKNSIARMRALQKIAEGELELAPMQNQIEGNALSSGYSTSSDAIVAHESSYHEIIENQIKQNWYLPSWLHAQKELACEIQITLNADGSIKTLSFIKSSGNPEFDAHAKQAIELSHPFIIPASFTQKITEDSISVGFPL